VNRILATTLLTLATIPLVFGQTAGQQPGQGQSTGKQSTQSSGGAEQEIGALNREWVDAIIKRDAAAFERILADDYVGTYPDGTVETKAQIVVLNKKPAAPDEPTIESMEVSDPQMRVYGDAAVATALLTYKGRNKGQAFSAPQRMTIMYVKRNGRWQPVASHGSDVKQQSSQQPAATTEKK